MEFTWKDGLRLLRSVTFSRVVNAGKISFSYVLSDLFKKPWIWGLPLSLAYEPTTSCNLRCPECPSGLRSFTRATGDADLEEFSSIIHQAKKHVGYLTLYFQGEPYLNKQLFEMVQIAQKAKIYTATSTNAHYLNEENCKKTIDSGLERLIISLDGISDESYTKYRVGGSVDKVKEGVFRLVEMKKKLKAKTPSIVIQCIAFSHNEHEIEEINYICSRRNVRCRSGRFPYGSVR